MYISKFINNIKLDSKRLISFWRPFNRLDKIPLNKENNIKALYPNREDEGRITRFWDGISNLVFANSNDPDAEAEKYFQYSVERLMAQPGKFTFEKFSKYLEDLCLKLKLIGRRPISEEDIMGPLLQLRTQYRMTLKLTKSELESDSCDVITYETKKLVAEAVNATIKDVEDMLLHYDTCKTDRTWYFRRLILGRHLPTSHKEREFLSYQRPIGRLSQQLYPMTDSLEARKLKEMHDKRHYKKPMSKTWPWYRHPTSGRDYWRTRPYTKINKKLLK